MNHFAKMFRSTLFVAVIVATCVAQPFSAVHAEDATPPAEAKPTRIAFVDIELIVENSKAIRMALDAMDRDLASKARDIDAKEREFRRQRFEMDKQERVLSADERAKRRDDLSALQEEIDRMKFDMDQELRARERQLEPVLELIMRVVADVAERDKFDLVLRGEVVIYGSSQVDLTPAVVAELDSRAAEVIETFKAKPMDDASSDAPSGAPEKEYKEIVPNRAGLDNNDELLPMIP